MPATAINAPPITVEQYEGFEGYPGLRDELIYGRIVLSPQPKPIHQQVAKNIALKLDALLAGTPWVANQNSNIRFAGLHSMPAPDVFVTREELWVMACETDSYIAEPPLLAVEVLSPANKKRNVQDKIALYLDGGVGAVWVVSPRKETVEVFEVGRTPYTERKRVILPQPLSGVLSVLDFWSLRR